MLFAHWGHKSTTEQTNAICHALSITLCTRIQNAPVRDDLIRCVTVGDYRSLIGYTIPKDLSVSDLISVRQVLAFYQKREDLDIGIDKEAVAALAFHKAECYCKESNHIFSSWARGGFRFPRDVDAVLYGAVRKIAEMLGDVPRLDAIGVRFGPGSTTKVKKKNASPLSKLRAGLQCSEALAPYCRILLEQMPSWAFNIGTLSATADDVVVTVPVEIVPGRLGFVDKNAKTKRAIITEPCLNSMFQLGFGDYMASRFKRFGLNLTDQTKNQRLAREGSLTGRLATLDLVSASGTVSVGLVKHLLPFEWFNTLAALRTEEIEGWYADGSTYRLQQFSGMGNGYTFPLESVIFYALAKATCQCIGVPSGPNELSVFGDDIILHVDAVPLFRKVINACGFILNEEKSYWDGDFRESCGADYKSGINVRPIYVKDVLTGHDMFRLHNFFVENLDDELCKAIISYLDPSWILWGPKGYGDGHLHGQWSPVPHNTDREWGGVVFETYGWTAKTVRAKLRHGDIVAPLYSIYVDDSWCDGFTPAKPGTKDVDGSLLRNLIKVPVKGEPEHFRRMKIYTFGR